MLEGKKTRSRKLHEAGRVAVKRWQEGLLETKPVGPVGQHSDF